MPRLLIPVEDTVDGRDLDRRYTHIEVWAMKGERTRMAEVHVYAVARVDLGDGCYSTSHLMGDSAPTIEVERMPRLNRKRLWQIFEEQIESMTWQAIRALCERLGLRLTEEAHAAAPALSTAGE